MFNADSFTANIYQVRRVALDHRSGTLDAHVLSARWRSLAPKAMQMVDGNEMREEHGFFSQPMSDRNIVFALRRQESLQQQHRLLRQVPDSLEPRPRPWWRAQLRLTLPRFEFAQPIDFALLDGPHGYPLPELEVTTSTRTCALVQCLVVNDIHIPTIFRVRKIFLIEDEMFEPPHVERTHGLFRRI